MIYEFENHNKYFLGATLKISIIIDFLLIQSPGVLSEIIYLDIKKSSFSEVLKMRMKLIILGFYTQQ